MRSTITLPGIVFTRDCGRKCCTTPGPWGGFACQLVDDAPGGTVIVACSRCGESTGQCRDAWRAIDAWNAGQVVAGSAP